MSPDNQPSPGQFQRLVGRLSRCQSEVMSYLCHKWSAHVNAGASVHINGKRVCNLATIEALVARGLVRRVGQWEYRATDTGLVWRPNVKADLAPASGAQVQRLVGHTESQETKQ
jgi:hypothetical protein